MYLLKVRIQVAVHFPVAISDVHTQEVVSIIKCMCHACPDCIYVFQNSGKLYAPYIMVGSGVYICIAECSCHSSCQLIIQAGKCQVGDTDRKSTRLNSSHVKISYAV